MKSALSPLGYGQSLKGNFAGKRLLPKVPGQIWKMFPGQVPAICC